VDRCEYALPPIAWLRRVAGLLKSYTRCQVLLDLLLQVEARLFIQFPLDIVARNSDRKDQSTFSSQGLI